MKLGNKKQERWSQDWRKIGRKKGYVAEICYNNHYKEFYFALTKDDYVFNSLWKEMRYKSEEACLKACEEYIDTLSEGGVKIAEKIKNKCPFCGEIVERSFPEHNGFCECGAKYYYKDKVWLNRRTGEERKVNE